MTKPTVTVIAYQTVRRITQEGYHSVHTGHASKEEWCETVR